MTDYQALAERVVEMAGEGAEAQVRVTAGNHSLTRFANSYIHQNVGEESPTVDLKVAVDGRVASADTSQTSDDALRRLVDDTLAAARLQPVDADWAGLAPPAPTPDVEHWDDATAAADPAERARRVADFVAAGPELRAAGYCETIGANTYFANSAGQRAVGRESRAIIDGIHQSDTSAGGAHQAAVDIGSIDGAAAGAQAAQRARDSAAAYDVKPGEYEVVLGPECTATIAVFLAFYGYNAKSVAEGQSFVEVGSEQYDPAVDIWDDATDRRALGVPFDAEGTPKRRVDLVRAGVSTSLAHDRRTARAIGVESTGHAVPGGDAYGAVPVNVFFGGGDRAVGDMIAAVDRGLFVTTFNYCRVLDPKSMVVTGLTRNGTFMIENGEITGAVTNLRFTQSFVAALGAGRILGLGDDGRFADSEFGAGMIHAPSLHLAAWNFTGGAEG